MGLMLATALAFVLSQAGELPGAPDTTFEQRWDAMVAKQMIKKREEAKHEQPLEEEPRRVRHHHHARAASGCRFGHKVYHGQSWRCRR